MGKKLISYSISLSIQLTKVKSQVNNITYQRATNEKNYDTQKGESIMAGMKTVVNILGGKFDNIHPNFRYSYTLT